MNPKLIRYVTEQAAKQTKRQLLLLPKVSHVRNDFLFRLKSNFEFLARSNRFIES